MMSICLDDFMAAVDDALTPPEAAPFPVAEAQRERLIAARARGVQRAVRHAGLTGELAVAAEMVDEAITATPITYRTVEPGAV